MSNGKLPSWDETLPTWDETVEEVKKPNPVQSFITGGTKGLTFGFADELAGLLEAGGSMIGLRGLGGDIDKIRFETDEEDKESLKDIYSKGKQALLDKEALSKETNPKAFFGGEIGSAFVPGSAPLSAASKGLQLTKSAQAVKAAQALDALNKGKAFSGIANPLAKGLANTATKAGIEGGLYGLGTAEGNLLERADETLESGLLSAGVGGALKGAGEGLKFISPYLASGITGAKASNIKHYAESPLNKVGVKEMMRNPAEMQKVVNELQSISENLNLGTKETRGEIDNLLAEYSNLNYPEYQVSEIFDTAINKAKAGGDYSKNSVLKELERVKQAMINDKPNSDLTFPELSPRGGFNPQNIKKAIDVISPTAFPKHGTTFYGEAANQIGAAKDVRHNLNQLLMDEKIGVPGFKDAMGRLEKDVVDAQTFEKLIGKNPDTLLNVLKNAEKGKNPFKVEALKKYASPNMLDFDQKLKDYSVAADFIKPKRDLLNSSLPITSLAYGMTNPVGFGLASASLLRNEFGGRMVPGLVDTAQGITGIARKLQLTPDRFGRFAPVLLNAQQRGGDTSLQATHYLLQKQNPEYRQLMMENEEQNGY